MSESCFSMPAPPPSDRINGPATGEADGPAGSLPGSEIRIELRVAGGPRDVVEEINSPAFLKALRGGDRAAERAYSVLVRGLRGPLGRYVGRWFADAHAVEDILQETFLAVFRGVGRFEGKSRLTTWVHSLARHKAMDRLQEKYRGEAAVRADAGVFGGEPTGESRVPPPDEMAHRTLLIARILAAAAAIPAVYRETWRLRDIEELSGEETAARLAIDPVLVRVRLHRARHLIGAHLRESVPALDG
jgi:RNA polymerase sigma-70 factor (ECF subfamily)